MIFKNATTASNNQAEELNLESTLKAIEILEKEFPYNPVQRFYIGRREVQELCSTMDVRRINTPVGSIRLLGLCGFIDSPVVVLNFNSFMAKEIRPKKGNNEGWRCEVVYWDEFDMVIQLTEA